MFVKFSLNQSVSIWHELFIIPTTTMPTLKEMISNIEKQEIEKALRESDWVLAKAARKLGITERMIGYKVKKYGIRKESDRRTQKEQQ